MNDNALRALIGPQFDSVFAVTPPVETLAAYVARRVDTITATLGREDKEVAYALGDVACTPALLLAVRMGDECDIGRMVLQGIRQALRTKAESLAETEFLDREESQKCT